MRRLLTGLAAILAAVTLVTAAPILYVETMCRGSALPQQPARFTPDTTRPEARTYLVYPEWHIVYAYEGYAEALRTGQPHNFPYLSAISGFWTSLCGLTAEADQLGAPGFNAKATIYTIGASFSWEMLFKAAYEETLGRAFALAGPAPQDAVEAEMADDYATFLQQTPWYKYDFTGWSDRLWAATPVPARGWERRLALGLEWAAKAGYAKVIATAAAGLGPDAQRMQVAIAGMTADQIASLPDVTVIAEEGEIIIAEVPRYRRFTDIAQLLTRQGGRFREIAGNDDILVSAISTGEWYDDEVTKLVARTPRVGFSDDRLLLATKVGALHILLNNLEATRARLEHIYDY